MASLFFSSMSTVQAARTETARYVLPFPFPGQQARPAFPAAAGSGRFFRLVRFRRIGLGRIGLE